MTPERIRISQKKVCGNCRALFGMTNDLCSLRYPITTEKKHLTFNGVKTTDFVWIPKPDKPCPKPITLNNYMESQENYRNETTNKRTNMESQ